MEYEDHFLFPLVREPRSRWEKAGLSPRQERGFNRVATLLMALFVTGWLYSILLVPREALEGAPVARISTQLIRSPLSSRAPPEAAFLEDEFVRSFASQFEREVRGSSGAVNIRVVKPGEELDLPASADSLPSGAEIVLRPAGDTAGRVVSADSSPRDPGIWNLMLRMRDAVRPASEVAVVTLVPLSAKRRGRVGSYMVGSWPYESGGTPKA
ncbi:MAG TPA: hypothetical protein VFQ39_12785, partial [Longimicrobium sp.]|nr:hypothetical protein [Longimicrobium sp.]